MDSTPPPAATATPSGFLTALWGSDPLGLILVWKLKGKRSRWLPSPADADTFTSQPDVYTGVALSGRNYGQHGRCPAEETVALTGLFCDFDVNGTPTSNGKPKTGAAPSLDAAFELAHRLLEPTLIVNSGHGVQGWWLFEQPWLFDSAADRDRAAHASAQWHELHRRAAGWKIDGTHDLARLLRIPGTVNAKGGGHAPVELLERSERRYSVQELLERCAAAGPIELASPPAPNGTSPITPGTVDRDLLTNLLENDDDGEFTDAWKRKGSPPEDSSPSGWCMRLANYAVRAGLDDQQITNLLHTYRRKHDDTDKPAGWYERTIDKARTGRDRERREKAKHEATEETLGELEDMSDERQPDPVKVLDALNRLCPGLDARELVQQGRDVASARFALTLADATEVEIGPARVLWNPDRMVETIGTATGKTLVRVKQKRWDPVVTALLKAVRYVDIETEQEITLGWVQDYVDGRVVVAEDGGDWNDAAYGRRPFERDGLVHLTVKDLHFYVKRGLHEPIKSEDLQRRLTRAGFERSDVGCHAPGQPDRRTKRTFWRIARERLG